MKESINLTDIWNKYAKSGNHQLFRIIYEETKHICFLSAYKILSDEDLARDVVQNVFFRLIANRFRYTNVEKLESWLYRIIANECRKRLIHPSSSRTEPIPEDEPAFHPFAIAPISDSSLDAQDVLKVINLLPKRNHATILRMVLNGFTNGEIAEELKVSEKYVRDTKSAARKELSKKINDFI